MDTPSSQHWWILLLPHRAEDKVVSHVSPMLQLDLFWKERRFPKHEQREHHSCSGQVWGYLYVMIHVLFAPEESDIPVLPSDQFLSLLLHLQNLPQSEFRSHRWKAGASSSLWRNSGLCLSHFCTKDSLSTTYVSAPRWELGYNSHQHPGGECPQGESHMGRKEGPLTHS